MDDSLKSFTDKFQGGILTLKVKKVGPLPICSYFSGSQGLFVASERQAQVPDGFGLCHVFKSIWSMSVCRLIGGW